jgi:hypothetical protein
LQCGVTILQHLEKRGAQGITGSRQPSHPVLEHVKVAQDAQRTEESTRQLLHQSPCSMAVYFLHDCGDGTTTANRHAEVMNRIRIRKFPHAAEFLEDPAYPSMQPQLRRWLGANSHTSTHDNPPESSALSPKTPP